MYINGTLVSQMVDFMKTLYASPYMVMTDEEYTKHYYIEGERLCSKIGSGFGVAPYDPQGAPVAVLAGDFYDLPDDLHTMVQRGMACVGYDEEFIISEELKPAHNSESDPENDQYFYHPDHLGSSSFITDLYGNGIQHLQYLPFGENFVEQRLGSYDTPYKFSGKEKDDETGYSYFGARYYDSDLSVWLSVDPLASMYASFSPYNYCLNNPVRLIDPTGMAPDDWFEDGKGNTMWRNSKAATYKDAGGTVWKNVGENRIIVRGDNATVFTQSEDKNGNLHLHSQTVDFSYANSDGNSSQGKDAVLNMQHSNWSRDAAEEFWAEPTIGNWVSYCFKEVLSQYTDPVLVASGLSLGIVGLEALALKSGGPLVNDIANQAESWLGKNYMAKTNKAGDDIFLSKDGLRKMRFDIKNSHGDAPHIHLEEFSNGKWRDAILGKHRIYPK